MTNQSDWAPLERVSREALDRTARAAGKPPPSDADLLAAIRLCWEKNGYAPTEPELGELLGWKASGPGGVNDRLFDLERRGLVVRAHAPNGRALTRTLRVVDSPTPVVVHGETKAQEVNVDWQARVREKLFPPRPVKPVMIEPMAGRIVDGHMRVAVAEAAGREVPVETAPLQAGEWEELRRVALIGKKHLTVPRETMNVKMYFGGQLRVSQAVYDALGQPGFVRVYLNRTANVLALVPSEKTAESVKIYQIGSSNGLWIMSLRRLFNGVEMDPDWWEAKEPHVLTGPGVPEHLQNGVGIMLVERTERRVSRKGKAG